MDTAVVIIDVVINAVVGQNFGVEHIYSIWILWEFWWQTI